MAAANELGALLAAQKDWARSVVFDSAGTVLGSTCAPSAAELAALTHSYDDRDHTVGHGFTLCGDHFDVHRFHGDLIYGRRGDADEGEGIALCRTTTASGRTVFALVTYTFPVLSARAVPQLVEFCKEHVAPM